jgi:hypothetical protein
MPLSQRRKFATSRVLLLSLSFISLVICVVGATAHYHGRAWGSPWQPIGWLLSMLFLLLAFAPTPTQIRANFKSLINPTTAFFLFWILVYVLAHLWNFRTAPWNGNGLYDESGWDVFFLKNYVIGHPFQAAWLDHADITRETLYHYYVWAFFRAFGYNLLSFEAANSVIWFMQFIFALFLVHLFFRSYIVTSVAALTFTFLPYAFVYSFLGYRYPMATALSIASLYFLYLGFERTSYFHLSLGGILAGLCLASSTTGKQYIYVLVLFALLYVASQWKNLRQGVKWNSVVTVVYGFVAAAMPIFAYIAFSHGAYTYYEGTFFHKFWTALIGKPDEHDLSWYTTQAWKVFFSVPGPRILIPGVLPIPLPYYFFLLPGIVLALVKKRFEIVLLATIPVFGAFIAHLSEHRMLGAIPFWIILMAFTFAAVLKLTLRREFKVYLWGASAFILMWGLLPSILYINGLTKDTFGTYHYTQGQVAVSRFLRNIVAGKGPSNPRLERDELKRDESIPDPPYDTLVCQVGAWSVIHAFLHDYDDKKVLSLCGGGPSNTQTVQEIWSGGKKAIANYAPHGKDLKLMWQLDPPKTNKLIQMYQPLRALGTEETVSYSFVSGNAYGGESKFYVLNIPSKNIPEFQERVRILPDFLTPPAKPTPPPISGEWTRCANQMQQCTFGGTKIVRYGTDDVYSYGTFTDGVLCVDQIFGDPVVGVVKHCDYAEIGKPSPTPTPAPTPRSRRAVN